MRLKYYLRGLGIGIAVTAVVLSFSGNDKVPAMTDEQIVARAKELGMQEAVEEEQEAAEAVTDTETDALNEEISEAEVPVDKEAVAEADAQVKSEDAEADAQEADMPELGAEPETEPAETPKDAEGETVEKMVLITIKGGDSSVAVSRKVAEAGLVESAAAYDTYLCKNGYDKKLTVGVHEIPADATEEEIAVILTTRKK